MRRGAAGALSSILARSFLLQGSWNYERMLGLGFCHALLPGLRRCAGDEDALRDRARAHLEFFNTHPYMASYVLGSVLALEERRAEGGTVTGEEIARFKASLRGPLGALGDRLFWGTWRPLCGILGALGVIAWGWRGAALAIILYNVLHLWVRVAGLWSSYRKGRGTIEEFTRPLFRRAPEWLAWMGAFLAGALVPAGIAASCWPDRSYAGVAIVGIAGAAGILHRWSAPRTRAALGAILGVTLVGVMGATWLKP